MSFCVKKIFINMEAGLKVVQELKSIRSKYSKAIFDLEKCRESVEQLKSEKNSLIQKCEKNEEDFLKLEREKDSISTQLREALEKISLLENKKVDGNPKVILQQSTKNTASNKKQPKEIRELQTQNNVLEARLKQAEFGIQQKDSFERQKANASEQTENFEVEEILAHKITRRKKTYLIRWKGYDDGFDTWEPESNLKDCQEILEKYKRHHKI